MRYERDAITMLVYARNSIVTWHRLKFLRPSFTTYINFTKMQRLAFRKIFNQFSHISYLLLISFTTKFELQKSNYFCGFNINASEKKIMLSLSLSLSLSRNFVPYPCHTTRSGFFNFIYLQLQILQFKYWPSLQFWDTRNHRILARYTRFSKTRFSRACESECTRRESWTDH